MASHTLTAELADRWPDGTTVTVYPIAAARDGRAQPGGPSTFSGTFNATTGLTVTGVTANTQYVGWASVGGLGVPVRFTAIPSYVAPSKWSVVVAARRSALGFT